MMKSKNTAKDIKIMLKYYTHPIYIALPITIIIVLGLYVQKLSEKKLHDICNTFFNIGVSF